MGDEFVTRKEYEEHNRRMEDEHKRINHRLQESEENNKQNNRLLISVEKLALSMETMQKEQKEQGERLEILESRDGEIWRKVVSHGITVILGIIVGFIFKQIGIF